MEFIINTDLEKSLPSVIDFNFEEIKADLTEKLTHYNNLVVTEDSIIAAKGDKALLNKLKEAIDERRKSVKKLCLAPYEDFEKKCKELVSMIENPVKAIDTQIKAFDEIKQTEKYSALERFYKDNIGELENLVAIEKVLNPKWKNAGENLLSLTQDMMSKISKISQDLKIIYALKSEFEQQMIDVYLSNFDMSAALQTQTRLEAQKAELIKIKARQEEQKLQAHHEPPQSSPIVQCESLPIQQHSSPADVVSVPEEAKTIKVIFYDTTAEFRKDMKALTDKHNIKYGGIK